MLSFVREWLTPDNDPDHWDLIEGQGNFGSMDGDPAAAYRYTEARLSRAGPLLIQGRSDSSRTRASSVIVTAPSRLPGETVPPW